MTWTDMWLNEQKLHDIPVGTMVDVNRIGRCFVVYHHRDVDYGLLYAVSHSSPDAWNVDRYLAWPFFHPEGMATRRRRAVVGGLARGRLVPYDAIIPSGEPCVCGGCRLFRRMK